MNKTRQLLLKVIRESALITICIVPGLILSFKGLGSPWTMFRIARASLSSQVNHIVEYAVANSIYRSEHAGGEILQVALIKITGWSLESIAMIPVGSLLLALLCYSIARKTARSTWSASAITIYMTWYYPSLYSQYGTQTYAWTHVIFLAFILLLFFWLKNRVPILSILIMLVFVATFLHYHTTPLWIVAAMVMAIFAMRIRNKQGGMRHVPPSWSLPVFFVVLYLAFDTVIYENALVRFRDEAINEILIQSIINKIIAPLLGKTSIILNPFETVQINTRIATWTTLLVLLMLTIPIGFWCIARVYRLIRTRDLDVLFISQYDMLIWIIVFVAVAHSLIYSLYGVFLNLRVLPLGFPLILPLVTRRLRLGEQLELFLTSGLAGLAIVGFLSFAYFLTPDTTATETGLASGLFKNRDRLLGDAVVYGSLLMNTAENNYGNNIDLVWLDSNKYASVVGQRPVMQSDFDFLVIDMSNKPITSKGWVFFEPWTQHLSEINQNDDLDKIYDSNNLAVFQPKGTSLPDHRPAFNEFENPSHSFLSDAFWLVLAIISVAFLPGVIFVYIVQDSSTFKVDDASTFIGLSVGLSIVFVTFIGYITNFTPLGLGWFIPLSVIVPCGLLGWYLIIRRPYIRIQSSWVIPGLFLIITLLVWALLSTSVARTRTQRNAEFTEFFITQDNSQPNTITVNVVNRLNQPEKFTVIVKLDNFPAYRIGPIFVPPNTNWSENLDDIPDFANKRIIITLEKAGAPYKELKVSNYEN